MSDPPKSLPTLSFGAPATSGSSGFGFPNQTPAADNKTSGSLFGSTKTTSAPGAILFSGTGSTSGPTQQKSPFDATTNSGQTSSPFGGGRGTDPPASTGFSFGPPPTSGNSQTSGFIFGELSETGSDQAGKPLSGFSTPNKTSAPASSGQTQTLSPFSGASNTGGTGLFGGATATTPANGKPTNSFAFANASTTPAGPPPAAGNGAGTSGGFDFTNPQQKFSNMFGTQNAAQPSSQSTATTTAPSNLFGSLPQSSSASLFASSKPAETSANTATVAPSSTRLKSANSSSGTGLFNMTATGGGFFSNLNKTQASTAPASTVPATENTPPITESSQQSQQIRQDGAAQTSSLFAGLGNKSAGTTTTSQGTAPSLFSALGSGTSSSSASKPMFSFPSSTPTATTQPSSTPTTMAAGTSKSGFFSNPGASIASTSSATPATTAATGGFFANLGNPAEKSSSLAGENPSTAATSGPTTATAPAPSSSLFADPNKPATSTTASQPSTTAAADSTNTNNQPSSAANLGTSTSGPAPPAQSRLKNKSMDEIITRWASDLSKYQKEFQSQAEKVSKWDRMLVENSDKIQKLYGSTLEAERATSEVERQLSAVEGQQEELSGWLDRYEREVEDMMSRQVSQGEALQGPDQERERTYKLAEKLSERLDEMGKDLTSMIDEINDASSMISKNSRADDPISQIVRVLNSHLSQLQIIDQGAAALQAKVQAAQKVGQGHSSSNGFRGLGSDAADDFYRSYMGRR